MIAAPALEARLEATEGPGWDANGTRLQATLTCASLTPTCCSTQ